VETTSRLKRRDRRGRRAAERTQTPSKVDAPFLMLTLLLVFLGLVMLLSASYPSAWYDTKNVTGHDPFFYFSKQAVYALLGFCVMYLVSKLNYKGLAGLAIPIFLLACVAMLAVKVPGIGHSSGGANRWLKYPVQWQPSELGKMALIIYFSARLAKREERSPLEFNKRGTMGRFGNFLERIGFFELIPYGFVIIVMVGLLAIEPHMSATIQMVVIAAAILFAGGIAVGWFAAGGILVGSLLTVMILFTDYMTSRIQMWQDPDRDPLGKGMQAIQSLLAIGSGGLFGVGLGQGRQKFLYLPEAQNDFIFAIVCEELGLVGACLILLLFALLIIRGYWLALHAKDRFGSLMIVGIITLFAFQVFANVAVVTNLFPVTGISMPFFSYGGTALLIQMAEMGLVLAISRQNPIS
jgi:cell division protein FtsW